MTTNNFALVSAKQYERSTRSATSSTSTSTPHMNVEERYLGKTLIGKFIQNIVDVEVRSYYVLKGMLKR